MLSNISLSNFSLNPSWGACALSLEAHSYSVQFYDSTNQRRLWFQFEVRLSSRSNNEWKKNAFVFKIPKACSGLMDHAKFFMDYTLEPHERRCPTPAVRLLRLLYYAIEHTTCRKWTRPKFSDFTSICGTNRREIENSPRFVCVCLSLGAWNNLGTDNFPKSWPLLKKLLLNVAITQQGGFSIFLFFSRALSFHQGTNSIIAPHSISASRRRKIEKDYQTDRAVLGKFANTFAWILFTNRSTLEASSSCTLGLGRVSTQSGSEGKYSGSQKSWPMLPCISYRSMGHDFCGHLYSWGHIDGWQVIVFFFLQFVLV